MRSQSRQWEDPLHRALESFHLERVDLCNPLELSQLHESLASTGYLLQGTLTSDKRPAAKWKRIHPSQEEEESPMDLLNRMIDSRWDKDMDEMKKYMKMVIENMMMPLLPKLFMEMSPSPSFHEVGLVYRPPGSRIISPQV